MHPPWRGPLAFFTPPSVPLAPRPTPPPPCTPSRAPPATLGSPRAAGAADAARRRRPRLSASAPPPPPAASNPLPNQPLSCLPHRRTTIPHISPPHDFPHPSLLAFLSTLNCFFSGLAGCQPAVHPLARTFHSRSQRLQAAAVFPPSVSIASPPSPSHPTSVHYHCCRRTSTVLLCMCRLERFFCKHILPSIRYPLQPAAACLDAARACYNESSIVRPERRNGGLCQCGSGGRRGRRGRGNGRPHSSAAWVESG